MRGGRNFLVCRQVGRYLRGSVVQEINSVISEWGLEDQFKINKVDGTVTHRNGYQIVFAGLDDVQKLKSIRPARGAFTDVRVEEATETERKTIKQLLKRQRGGDPNTKKCLTLSFNPILQSHWIYEDFFSTAKWADEQEYYQGDRITILKTIYKHNQFLTPEDVYDLEHEEDKYHYDVYTLGKWGVLGNVIFTNYEFRDLSGMRDQFTNRKHGLDFGFSSNPAAVPVTHYDRDIKTIYIYDELYERGLTNDLLADEIKRLIGSDIIRCDSAEPKSIAELRQYDVSAIEAVKGKDSVNHGIQWLQQQKIVIDVKCINAKREFQSYKWREDKDGNSLEEPLDRDNHLIDGLRYAYEEEFIGDSHGEHVPAEVYRIGSTDY